jgi:short-subunit dehydrogenase
MKRLQDGNVIIITGASTGIGRDMAIKLARKYKIKLVLNARSADGLADTAKQAEALGAEVVTVCGDIGDKHVIENVTQQTRARFGTPDVLVNNAGFAIPGAMHRLSVEDWRKVFEVNFFAPVALTYAFMPEMLDRRKGMVVNIASVAGKIAFPGSVCYASTKFALTGFSEGMAAELGPKGIDVITVCPGLVRTEFFRKNKNRHDVTAMAEEKSVYGWVLKNIASISSQQAADQILKACERGGCQEIVLTAPGVFLERLAGIYPPAAWWISKFVPADRGPQQSIQQ